MRRHTWSGATAMVVLSLIVGACGEKSAGGAGGTTPVTPTTPPGSTAISLARRADTLDVDESVQLNAIVPPTPGDVAPITWASSDTNVAIVTPTGVIFAVKSGTTIVTATTRGATASTTVTVHPTIREVRLEADTLAISVSDSVRLPYHVTDSDGREVDLSTHSVEWTSSAPDIAPLTGDATITGRALGNTDVMLRVDSRIGRTSVRVMPKPTAGIAVAPASVTMPLGQRVQLTPRLTDAQGNTVTNKVVSWSSSNTALVNVTSDGMVVALGAGHATVTARVESKTATVPVDVTPLNSPVVTPAPVASVTLVLAASSIQVGQTTQGTATLKDAASNVLSSRAIAWTTSDATLASVSATGLVTALKSGTVTVTATSDGKSGSASLAITASPVPQPPSVATVSVKLAASVVTVGNSTQATAVLKDSTGAVLTGRPLAWVSSDATVATVDAAGLVSSLKAGSVTITASSNGKIGSAVFTANTPPPVVKNVLVSANATTLKIGQLTQASAVAKDANGATITGVPITWTSSSMGVASITAAGMIAARSVGVATISAKADTVVRSITITVLDSATAPVTPPVVTPPIVTPPVIVAPTGPTYGTATPAELPRLSVNTAYPTMTRQVRVPAGASLQGAINAAQPGDELLLAPGASYIGNFTLPNKGVNNAWIVIRTDLPDAVIGNPGARMTPSRAAAANLAKIITPAGQSTIITAIGANHYRLTGVEVGVTTAAEVNGIIRFGETSMAQNTTASIAHDLVLDRSWVHGGPNFEVRRCVMLNSATTAVIDSWLGDCHSNVSDSQALSGWNGTGPFLIENNHLEAGHEVVAFGGSTATIVNQSPSDITFRGNHVMRPLSWKGRWQVKNLLETKHVRRMLIEGNVFENNWADAQAGFAFVIKSENQNNDNPWTTSSDITIRYNKIRNSGNGINLAANPSGIPAIPAARIVITDNVMENINVAPFDGDGHTLQLIGGLSDVVMMHNTVVSAGGGGAFSVLLAQLPAIQKLVIHSNVLQRGGYGVKGGGTGEGTQSLANYAPGYLFSNNAMTAGGTASAYPTGNFFPANLSALGFANLTGLNYRLSSSSTYYNKGYDGRDIGADIAQVDAKTNNVVIDP